MSTKDRSRNKISRDNVRFNILETGEVLFLCQTRWGKSVSANDLFYTNVQYFETFQANPAMKVAVKSVKESSRGIQHKSKSAYKGIRSKMKTTNSSSHLNEDGAAGFNGR